MYCKLYLRTSENLLCYFMACLGQQGLPHLTIKTYLSGIQQVQIAHGFQDPHIDQIPRLCQVLSGVKTEARQQGRAPTHAYLLLLQKPKAVWLGSGQYFDKSMLHMGCFHHNFFHILRLRGDGSGEQSRTTQISTSHMMTWQ